MSHSLSRKGKRSHSPPISSSKKSKPDRKVQTNKLVQDCRSYLKSYKRAVHDSNKKSTQTTPQRPQTALFEAPSFSSIMLSSTEVCPEKVHKMFPIHSHHLKHVEPYSTSSSSNTPTFIAHFDSHANFLAAIYDPTSPFVRSPAFLTEGGWLASEHLEKMLLLNLPQPTSSIEDYTTSLRDHITSTTGVQPKSITFPRGTDRKRFHAIVILPQKVDATVLNSVQSMPFLNTIILAGGTATPALHRCTKCHQLNHKHRDCPQTHQIHITIHLKANIYSYQLPPIQKALKANSICLGLPCQTPSINHKTITLTYHHPQDFHKTFRNPSKAFAILAHQRPTNMYQWTHDSLCITCHHPPTSPSTTCPHHRQGPHHHQKLSNHQSRQESHNPAPPPPPSNKSPPPPPPSPKKTPPPPPSKPIPSPHTPTSSTENSVLQSNTTSPTTNSIPPAPDGTPLLQHVLASDPSPEITREPTPPALIQPQSTGNEDLDRDLLYFPKLIDPTTLSSLANLAENPTTQIIPHANHHTMGLYCQPSNPDQMLKYSWGKQHLTSNTWDETLTTTLDDIQSKIQHQLRPLNSCLFNHFKTGSDKTPKHSDTKQTSKEPDYVVLVAVGHPRPFIFSNKNSNIEVTITLNPGDVLILTTGCNIRWTHERPPVPELKHPSFSFTFRNLPQPHSKPIARSR